jgi:hypothetical protein
VGQAAAKATEQIGEAAVEASGKASFTPKNSDEAARSGGQQRRPASRRSGEGKTTRGSKRGTRSRPSKSTTSWDACPTAGNDRGTRRT